RKFLRKTNAAEPSDQFAQLACRCERCDLCQYASLSWYAVARCEASLGRAPQQASALASAGRQLLLAEKRAVGGCREQLSAGLSCLREAERLWADDPETGRSLQSAASSAQSASTLSDSIPAYTRAVQALDKSPHNRLHALSRLASVKISLGEYDSALSIFSDIVSTVRSVTAKPFGVYNDTLIRCEISRVLLVLLLRANSQKLSPDLVELVEKYTWIGKTDPDTIILLGEELFLLLQALVMSCQSQDAESAQRLESDLWKHLSAEQKDMLRIILDDLNDMEK
ncbi:hypothetical protein AAG570_005476, partial [Ranatra chinensis]